MENISENYENIVITDARPLSWAPPKEHVQDERDRHPNLTPSTEDGEDYGLPGWKVKIRPRTNPKYYGKYDKIFYEPETKKQFRSLKKALSHVNEIKAKQNQQQEQSGLETDYSHESEQKDELKPVMEKLEIQSEAMQNVAEAKRLKDVHKFMRAFAENQARAEQDHGQASGQTDEQTPVVVQNGKQPEASLENPQSELEE